MSALVGAVVVGAVVGGIAVARADSPDTTINGCFNTATGNVRVLTDSAPGCDDKTESPLSWNAAQPSTRWFRDYDHDGYGDWYEFVDSPAQPPGFVADNTDCNDNDATISPAQTSDPGPGDRNCNGVQAEDQPVAWYRDADNDGWGSEAHAVTAPLSRRPLGYVHRYGDCDDHDAKVHPYQTKCHGGRDADIDGDGHRGPQAGGDDCDDANPREFPGNTEKAHGYGWDHDCDPTTGGMLLYDPHFLDERPHGDPVAGYQMWDGNHLRAGIATGIPAGAGQCFDSGSDYGAFGPGCQALDFQVPKAGFPAH